MAGRMCQTCTTKPAVARARRRSQPWGKREPSWVVCASCRDQGKKHRADVEYSAL